MGREKSISDIGKISKTDKLKLINEYISNKHYLIESQLKNTSEYSNSLKENQKFDYVFIDIFHRQHSYFHDLKHFSGFEIEHLSTISKKGFALIVANVDEFSSDKVKKIMHEQGYYLNAVFGLPLANTRYKKILKNQSIFCISKRRSTSLFVADLSKHYPGDSGWKVIVSNFFESKSGSDLSQGMYIKIENFYNFDMLRAIQRVKDLTSYYDEYEELELKHVLVSVNESVDTIENFEESENGVFIIKNILNNGDLLPATTDKEYVENVNSWPYYYAILNNKIDSQYIAIFLQSHIGHALMQTVANIANQSNKNNKERIEEIPIFFPPIDVQKKIIMTHNKVMDLQESIDKFRNNLSLNPSQFINESINKIDNMLDLVGKLNETDKVRQLVERGEGITIEFKQTFGLETNSKNPKYGKSNDALKERIFEQISAFLNSYGGVLLIGVHDDQHITGMAEELRVLYGKSHDKFKLRFHEEISKYLGKEFTSPDYITYGFVPIDNYEVFKINCKRSTIPCRFGKEERLIVQEDPRIKTLKGEAEMRYISKHFPEYYASHFHL